MHKKLTCYAVGNDEGWEAFCIDFDIAVQGMAFNDVHATLTDAICSYVEDAMQESPEQSHLLLNRQVPWHVRWALKFKFWWSWLTNNGNSDGESAGFTIACHA